MKKALQLEKETVEPPASTLPAFPAVTYHAQKRLWSLVHDYTYSNPQVSITIRAGFEFDLASVPSLLWPVIAPFQLSIAAPLIHDYLYQKGGVPEVVTPPGTTFTRKETDDLFLEIMEREGVAAWRRRIGYRAVRWFGGGAWNKPIAPLTPVQRLLLPGG